MAVFVGYLGAFDLVPRSHYVLYGRSGMTTWQQHSPGGGGVLPIMAYTPGEAPPEGGIFFRHHVLCMKG